MSTTHAVDTLHHIDRPPRLRIGEVDALRGVGALMVMCHHFQDQLSSEGHSGLWIHVPLAQYAVQTFFLISGYMILMTARRSRTLGEFALTRWARLYPTFWLCCILTYATIRIFEPTFNDISPGMAALNLLMVQTPNFRPIDWPYWTLHQEMWFYLVIAALLLIRRLDAALWVLAGLVFTSLCTLQFTRWFSLFLVGMVMFDSRERFRPRHAGLLALCAADILRRSVGFPTELLPGTLAHLVSRAGDFLLSLGVRPAPPKADANVAGWTYPLFVTAVTAVVWSCTRLRLPWFANPVLRFFGGISYPLYLLHATIGAIIMHRAMNAGAGVNLAWSIAVTSVMLLAIAVSYGVEKPMVRWAAARVRAKRERLAGAQAQT